MNKTALLVIDLVYDFTNENGLVFYPENKLIIPKVNEVIRTFRDNNGLVIFMQHTYRKNKYDKNLETMRPNCIEGTGGNVIDPLLDLNEETDYVIKKRRYSAFYGTDLDLVLRENNIENVIITGTKTNCCIRSTVHDAYYNNYSVYVVKECVATNDEVVNQVHLNDIDKYYGKVISMNEVKNIFKESL